MRSTKDLKDIVAHARMSNFIVDPTDKDYKEEDPKIIKTPNGFRPAKNGMGNMMRSTITTTGASFNELNQPINEHISVESSSDDNETYDNRFKRKANKSKISFKGNHRTNPDYNDSGTRAAPGTWESKFKR